MRIDVTEQDILEGHPGDAEGCALALAIQRATGCNEVLVGYNTVSYGPDVGEEYALPPEARNWVRAFDQAVTGEDREFEPFSFELPIPEVARG